MQKVKPNKLPKISIIIPSYNKIDYIGETLESIVTQNYSNFEVIIQDGGSTDGTVEIIKIYAKKYPKFVTWESKKDKGQVDAINKGMRKAEGDILAYINADDVYENNAFNAVAEAYQNNPEALWFAGQGRVIDKNGAEIAKWVTAYKNLLLSINHYSLLLIVNYLMQPSVFITKTAYKLYGPFTGTRNFVLEFDMWLKIGKEKMPCVVKNTLSGFRIAGDNITSNDYIRLLDNDEKVLSDHTNNPFIRSLHKLHNLGRQCTINLLK